MAYLKQPKSEEEIKKLTVTNVKKAYNELATDYNRLIDLNYVYCPNCGDWKASSSFYTSNKTKSGLEHLGCKSCILEMATDLVDKKNNIRKDNREKTIEVFRKLDMPFIETTYNSQLNLLADNVAEKQRSTAFSQLLTLTRSLPQYKNKTFKDSEFLDENGNLSTSSNKKPRKEIVRLFGNMPNDDLLYLQDQYDDWKDRVKIETKPQETYLVQICLILLEIYKARIAGKDADKLVKSLNEVMAASNLQPRQSVANASSDNLTFGQLIEKWENEECIEPDPELDDVDGIRKYINVFFKGHLAKMMGLKNAFSQEYDEYMEQYTVKKPTYDEDEESSDIYDALFGKEVE